MITAGFFVAVWWFAPTVYAFTDTAFTASLSIALVNLLPAYPLDGGRILRCALARAFSKTLPNERAAEQKATSVCRIVSLIISAVLLTLFVVTCIKNTPNFSLLAFAVFLLFGSFGNKDKTAVYAKIDFSVVDILEKGAEIRRVAVLDTYAIKDVFKFLARGSYLVLEVYDERENHLFDLSQNELSELFLHADTPYATLRELTQKRKTMPVKIVKTAIF